MSFTVSAAEPPPTPPRSDWFWHGWCIKLFLMLMFAYMLNPEDPSFSNPVVLSFFCSTSLVWFFHSLLGSKLRELQHPRPPPRYPPRDWFNWKASCGILTYPLSAGCVAFLYSGDDASFLTPTMSIWCIYFLSAVRTFCAISISEEVGSRFY
ncbi:hypothetical protein ACE6H2_020768 [Prunus campanulata]